MTTSKIFSLALMIAYILFSITARANSNNSQETEKTNSSKQMENPVNQGKSSSHSMEDHSKGNHGKLHAPHSEEEPHIHKFHKERVKKIRKHPGKYWLLSQVLLFLAHAAILYISYLHALH